MAGPAILTPALILGSIRYGETSRILRVATRDLGVQSAIAKGASRPRSRFGAALQLLSEGHAHLIPSRTSELCTLAAFDLTQLHSGLATDLDRFAAASALAELAARFVPPIANAGLYDELCEAVALLELAPAPATMVVGLRAMWRLIGDLGLAPVVTSCARDAAALPGDDVAFSVRDGGFLCAACAAAGATTRLAADDRDALVSLITRGRPLPVLTDRQGAAHRRLLVRWVHEHLGETAMPALDQWQRGTAPHR